MSIPVDDLRRVYELHAEGFGQRAIEQYTGVSRCEVRRILGLVKSHKPVATNDQLSVRERQRLLSWARP